MSSVRVYQPPSPDTSAASVVTGSSAHNSIGCCLALLCDKMCAKIDFFFYFTFILPLPSLISLVLPKLSILSHCHTVTRAANDHLAYVRTHVYRYMIVRVGFVCKQVKCYRVHINIACVYIHTHHANAHTSLCNGSSAGVYYNENTIYYDFILLYYIYTYGYCILYWN